MHPPYHNIIKFSKDPRDLSNARSVETFIKMFTEVIDNTTPYLERGRYLGIVIGDKYSAGKWIPLVWLTRRFTYLTDNQMIMKEIYLNNCFVTFCSA